MRAARVRSAAVTAAQLRKLCLEFPGAYEDFPFGPETSVFKVEKKLFAISALRSSPLKVSLKCEPERLMYEFAVPVH